MSAPSAVRVLVFGQHGMLGSELVRSIPAGFVLSAPAGGRVDLRDHRRVADMLRSERPDLVINAAAYTDVDGAERDEAAARAVNAVAVGALGDACASLGIRICHFSTDYVFSGDAARPYREDDPTAPLSAYGRSKLEGEQLLHASGARALVVRTQWLFGRQGRSFPFTMWQRARAGLPTRVVDDQTGRPTYTMDLAAATWALVRREHEGLVHVTNSGEATWHDVAAAVFSSVGTGQSLSPCGSIEYPTVARRPVDSRLDHARADALLGSPLPHWRDALQRFLAEVGHGERVP